jgi:hypothetical protein
MTSASANADDALKRTAHCHCGSLHILCTGEPRKISMCHCDDCQRRTGSLFSIAVFYNADQITIRGRSSVYERASASYVERQNLTIRMHMRRFTRLTNAFSKKVENHAHAVALHMMYYNFVRIHKTLRVTPAMAASVSDRLWEIADIVKLVEDGEVVPKKRGPYNKG